MESDDGEATASTTPMSALESRRRRHDIKQDHLALQVMVSSRVTAAVLRGIEFAMCTGITSMGVPCVAC